jgi:hypothetical protein
LAVFSSPGRFELYELQRPVRELLVVADSFHAKPLMRILQSADRFQILCLNRQETKLYEGNRDALDPVELTDFPVTIPAVLGDDLPEPQHMIGSYGVKGAGGGTAVHHFHGSTRDEVEADMLRFFRAIDRGILEHHSRPSGLPLLLAALPEYHEPFRNVSHNPYLISEGIKTNPDALGVDDLRQEAWQKLEPHYLSRLEKLKADFQNARAQHTGSADLSDVAKAAVTNRVATFLVEADRPALPIGPPDRCELPRPRTVTSTTCSTIWPRSCLPRVAKWWLFRRNGCRPSRDWPRFTGSKGP